MINPEPKNCCGCTACASICTHRAISMRADRMGFLFPSVDTSKCVNCGLCEKVCPLTNKNQDGLCSTPLFVYAARHKDENEISNSRSGAVFIALSDIVLDNNGAVYGAAFDSDFVVKHKRATTKNERDTFRGSKYVQSNCTNCFDLVNKDLQDGRQVLFSGTPCQVAAVKKIIPTNLQHNLLLIDIVCHGVPSPRMFRDYLESRKRKNDTIIQFNFRDKSLNGWDDHRESIVYMKKGKIYSKLYTQLFYSNSFFRESCYECPFAKTDRLGDITIGDFWGWEKVDPYFNKDNKGCSLVYLNTEKGVRFFESVENMMNLIRTDINHSLQRNLQIPTPRPDKRCDLVEWYIDNGFDSLIKKYFTASITAKVKQKLSQLLSSVRK